MNLNERNEENILDFVKAHVHLTQEGEQYVGQCPFHTGEEKSLKVSPSKGQFKCFVCGTGGDVNQFKKEIHKVANHE